MINSLKRIIKNGCLNFYRNLGLSIATCFIIAMTILLITSLFLLKDITEKFVGNLREKVDISVYFKQIAPEEEIIKIKEEIAKLPEVKKIEYISRDEALKRFVERYQNNPVIMESLLEVGNPLLPSINITAWQASQYSVLTNYLENIPQKDLIQKVDYFERKSVIERIDTISLTISFAGIILSIILATIAVLVAFNQVRLAIYSVREEIAIQRLVGASNWFIRGPFLFQGAIAGLFAAVVSFIVFIIALYIFSPKMIILSSDLNLLKVFSEKFWFYLFINFTSGIVLGVLSSFLAIRKYLNI
jgi:cell division transport system permease protein